MNKPVHYVTVFNFWGYRTLLERWLLCLIVAAVAPAQAASLARISGEVYTLERMALPADALLTLELVDTTPDARGGRLARLALAARGRQVPLAFELPVYAADLDVARQYQLRATIINGGGELLFSGGQALAGDAARVSLRLSRAGERHPSASLEDTHWKLVEVGGQPARVQAGEREAYLLLLDGLASGGSGCNKLMGRYTVGTRSQLTLGPMASTRMACTPELMAQESALHSAFSRTTGYRIDGNTLELRDDDNVLARFTSRATP
ncbi:MAG TPA: META domain-containing protein [Thiobacillus sp.]|nr:META domain-containing protein [Thiobacillus sp.]